MNIKDIFSKKIHRDDEFDADFVDHPIGNQNLYRLHYYESYKRGNEGNYGLVDMYYKPFMLPLEMSREDGFKVLSYLTDYIEEKGNMKECSLKSVQTLDQVLDLERLGFTRVEEYQEEDVIDLFTVTGRVKRFMNTPYYEKYFEWYIPGVKREEVVDIYNNLNMAFMDLVPVKEEKTRNLCK